MSNNLRTQVFISQRQAENIKTVNNEMECRVKYPPKRTYEETVMFQLGTIATTLINISKSLAVIADNAESGEK